MAEMIDVLSETGLRTGEILPRAEIHRLGKIHRAVHLYLFNSRKELLLQQRSSSVDHAPGMFSISVVGHIEAGEHSSHAIRREIEEELVIDASRLQLDFLFSHYQEAVLHGTYIDKQFNDVYVARLDLDLALVRFDPSEVVELRFVPFESFLEMVAGEASGLAPVYANECRDLVYFLGASPGR